MLKRRLFWYALAALFFIVAVLGMTVVVMAAVDASSGWVLARGSVGGFLCMYVAVWCFSKGQKS